MRSFMAQEQTILVETTQFDNFDIFVKSNEQHREQYHIDICK